MSSRHLGFGWFALSIYLIGIHFFATAIMFFTPSKENDGGAMYFMLHTSPPREFWLLLWLLIIVFFTTGLTLIFNKVKPTNIYTPSGFAVLACSIYLYGQYFLFEALGVGLYGWTHSKMIAQYLRSHRFYYRSCRQKAQLFQGWDESRRCSVIPLWDC
ncbi:hypothetical protein [Laceyella putida]|uniref:Uncharacterized protein n=1 Tax=Laceyella putida TaxID=110101 RepID=A0ABW2RQ29_9BACL